MYTVTNFVPEGYQKQPNRLETRVDSLRSTGKLSLRD